MACRQWQRRRRRRAERRAGRRSLSAADRQPAACMLPLLVLRPPSCCCTRTHAWSAVSMITCTAGPQWAASGHGRPVALAPASLLPCLLLLLLLDVRTEDQRSRGTEERSWERQKAVSKKSGRLPAWCGGGGGHVQRTAAAAPPQSSKTALSPPCPAYSACKMRLRVPAPKRSVPETGGAAEGGCRVARPARGGQAIVQDKSEHVSAR